MIKNVLPVLSPVPVSGNYLSGLHVVISGRNRNWPIVFSVKVVYVCGYSYVWVA
jgi:hypothetical protein